VSAAPDCQQCAAAGCGANRLADVLYICGAQYGRGTAIGDAIPYLAAAIILWVTWSDQLPAATVSRQLLDEQIGHRIPSNPASTR